MAGVILAAATQGAHAQHADNWEIDPVHSSISFTVRHMEVANVRGEFSKLSGAGYFDGKNLSTARIHVLIDAGSINTRYSARDQDLKSARFLDVAKYPSITFDSTKITPAKSSFTMEGNFTLHGVTRHIMLHGNGPLGPSVNPYDKAIMIGASATGVINRKDYGIVFNDLLDHGGAVVGDTIKIELDVELVKMNGDWDKVKDYTKPLRPRAP